MAHFQTGIETEMQTLRDCLRNMPENLRLFSLSMRSLYSDTAVGTSTDASTSFRRLREETRQDASVYIKVLLPLTTKFVLLIKEYFEYYESLSYENWCEMLPEFLEELTTRKDVAQQVLGMYKSITAPLKRRQNEAKIIMTEMKDLQSEFEMIAKKLKDKAETKKFWSLALLMIPGVNWIASPLLQLSANSDSAKAIAKNVESDIHEAAIVVVAETLIPALANVINGVQKATGFFETMEVELHSFEGGTNTSRKSQAIHYRVVKSQAKSMISLCLAFFEALPDVRTDFRSIPDTNTDRNYVDNWLQRKMEEIKQMKREKSKQALIEILKAVGKGIYIASKLVL